MKKQFYIFIFFLLLSSSSTRSYAETTFFQLANKFSKEKRAYLIFEGFPLKAEKEVLPNEIWEDFLDKYDYEEKHNGNVIYLRKKYNRSYDLPCITMGEIENSQESIGKLFEKYSKKLPKNFTTSDFGRCIVSSLPQEYKEKDGRIKISDLGTSQKDIITKLLYGNYIQDATGFGYSSVNFSLYLNGKYGEFEKQVRNINVFMYCVSNQDKETKKEIAIPLTSFIIDFIQIYLS
jgi:hypothetical protein